MNDGIFSQDWYKFFNQSSMNDFLKISQEFKKIGLTPKDVYDAIQSACYFFGIPMPRIIQDVTNVKNGQTMFVNWDRNSYEDDVLCFNMRQLEDMKVDSKDAFSLVMTHECAHRALQNTKFPGINNGIWERELAADFFMGCRAGLWNMDESKIVVGLILTKGSPTHPVGAIRAMFVNYGKYIAMEMRNKSIPLTIQNLLIEFMAYCQKNVDEILYFQRKFYRF